MGLFRQLFGSSPAGPGPVFCYKADTGETFITAQQYANLCIGWATSMADLLVPQLSVMGDYRDEADLIVKIQQSPHAAGFQARVLFITAYLTYPALVLNVPQDIFKLIMKEIADSIDSERIMVNFGKTNGLSTSNFLGKY
ncbi:MAG: hypothetical protein HZB40_17010 [Rhodocyclales bacterium]|nr:hypothetical protein [Rhodocyclales bacterium]